MILDIILIAIIGLAIFIGYKKGLMKLILKFVGVILSLVLAYVFCNPLANFIYEDLAMGPKMSESISDGINEYIEDKKEENNIDEYIEKFEGILSAKEQDELKTENIEANIITKVSDKITLFILKGAAFIIIVILINICVLIASLISDGLTNLPVIKTFNKTGGSILSVIITIIKIWIVLGILLILEPMGIISGVIDYINNSVLVAWLYNNNILMSIILKTIS